MDIRDRTASFAGRWACGATDKAIMNTTMLRFRPIAPRPAIADDPSPEKKNEIVAKVKARRKYSKSQKKNTCKKTKDKVPSVFTLQLLPRVGLRQDAPAGGSSRNTDFPAAQPPMWMNFNANSEDSAMFACCLSDLTAAAAEMWVTVEQVTDTCTEGGGLGDEDAERIGSLESDTCPGFISDSENRVWWTNTACRKMVGSEQDGGPPPKVAVQLVLAADLPAACPAFACRARVKNKGKYLQVVPCDVWRMDFGGFAWRLDVKAALNLGR